MSETAAILKEIDALVAEATAPVPEPAAPQKRPKAKAPGRPAYSERPGTDPGWGDDLRADFEADDPAVTPKATAPPVAVPARAPVASRREAISQYPARGEFAGLTVEADPEVVAARQKAGELLGKWQDVATKVEAAGSGLGLDPRKDRASQIEELAVQRLLAGEDAADVANLELLLKVEPRAHEAARRAAVAVGPVLEDAARRLYGKVTDALRPAAQAVVKSHLAAVAARREFDKLVREAGDAGLVHAEFVIPRPEVNDDRLRQWVQAGLATEVEIAPLLGAYWPGGPYES